MSDVENNAASTSRRPGGITGKGFQPGRSGNLGGRPKGLAALVRQKTGNGRRLVELMWDIARGEPITLSIVTLTGQVLDVQRRPSISDRIDAAKWLSDRGWGRAREVIQLDDDGIRQGPLLVFLGGQGDPLAPRRASLSAAEETVIDLTPRAKEVVRVRPTIPLPEVAFDMEEREPRG